MGNNHRSAPSISDFGALEKECRFVYTLSMMTDIAPVELGAQWKIPRLGDVVEGTVLVKHGSVVFVDLGFGTGIIYGKEYQDGRDMLKHREVGDALVTKIVELENEDGYIELSVKEAGREKFWKEEDLKDGLCPDHQPSPNHAISENDQRVVVLQCPENR